MAISTAPFRRYRIPHSTSDGYWSLARCTPGARDRQRGARALGVQREVFPETKEQRCWFRKTANVQPKSAYHNAKKALAGIWNVEDKPHALAVKAFEAAYGARFPKATVRITGNPPSTGYTCA